MSNRPFQRSVLLPLGDDGDQAEAWHLECTDDTACDHRCLRRFRRRDRDHSVKRTLLVSLVKPRVHPGRAGPRQAHDADSEEAPFNPRCH